MEIEEQQKTYSSFMKWTVRSIIGITVLLVLMKVTLV